MTFPSLDDLQTALQSLLGERVKRLERQRDELTLTVAATDYLDVAKLLHEHPALAFEQLIDLCGMDYQSYKDGASALADGPRFARRASWSSVSPTRGTPATMAMVAGVAPFARTMASTSRAMERLSG